jgi:hypothetical protein
MFTDLINEITYSAMLMSCPQYVVPSPAVIIPF